MSRDTLRVDWTGIVERRECADSFLVKYWCEHEYVYIFF